MAAAGGGRRGGDPVAEEAGAAARTEDDAEVMRIIAMGSPVLAANGTPYALPSARGVLQHVPDELLPIIFSYLGPAGTAACMGVCRHWRFVARDELLWREFSRQACRLHFSPFPGAVPAPPYSIDEDAARTAAAGGGAAGPAATAVSVWDEARVLAKHLRSWRAMVHRIPQPRFSGPYILRSSYFRKPWRDLWHDPPPFILCEYHRSLWFDAHGSVLCGNTAGDVRGAMRALRRARQSLADPAALAHGADEADERRRRSAEAPDGGLPPGVTLGFFRMHAELVEVVQPVLRGGAMRWVLAVGRDERGRSNGSLQVVQVRIRDPLPAGMVSPSEKRVRAEVDHADPPILASSRAPRAWPARALHLFHPTLWTDEKSVSVRLDPDTFDFLPAHRIL